MVEITNIEEPTLKYDKVKKRWERQKCIYEWILREEGEYERLYQIINGVS